MNRESIEELDIRISEEYEKNVEEARLWSDKNKGGDPLPPLLDRIVDLSFQIKETQEKIFEKIQEI